MNRIDQTFLQLKEQGRQALIPFITAGDPNLALTLKLMHGLVDAGADIIELGIPFSDPMSDGPVIQLASERALESGTSLTQVIDLVSQFRQDNDSTPVVLMGYLNPVEVMGYESFANKAAKAGVDGVLTVDMPPEESHQLVAAMKQVNLAPIYLIAPTTTDARIGKIVALSQGYIYFVSLKGVTGSAALDIDSVAHHLKRIRQQTELPTGVGFGIKTPETAAQVSAIADAVVVGSVLVQKVADNRNDEAAIFQQITALLAEMRQAMDNNR